MQVPVERRVRAQTRICTPCRTVCACGPAIAGLQSQQGEARVADGGNLLYREQRPIRRYGDRIRERLVLYRCADGTANDHRLRRFKGISDLRSDRGKPLMVRIDFPQPAKVADASQRQAMRVLPLQPCARLPCASES